MLALRFEDPEPAAELYESWRAHNAHETEAGRDGISVVAFILRHETSNLYTGQNT